MLTLSATPIPRTLHMSLSGIKDMSTIEEPPEDRYPVQTYVMEMDDFVIREAIERSWRVEVRFMCCTTGWIPSIGSPAR